MNNLISNRYLITKHIGKGGMADVYLAIDTILKREVAIKILKADLSQDKISLERFSREANASTCLSHPNIVDVYDVGDDGDRHYIVMEYIKGQTLKQFIQKRGPIYYPEAIFIMKQLCAAIMEAHRNGIIHRDIKSQNVLIKDDGTAKVVDFGIALAANAKEITAEDSILGSVHYMAPEHAKGETANMQSDIYSLGIVFFELLTGEVPFKGENAVQVVYNSSNNPLPDVRLYDKRIPQSVVNITKKATAKNRHNRYANVAEMLKDLNECLLDKHLDDKPLVFNYSEDITKPKEAKKEIKRSRPKSFYYKLAAIAGGVLIVLILGAYLINSILNRPVYVNMPDIRGYSIVDASKILEEYGLSIDLTHIEREMSDVYDAGEIMRIEPEVNAEVEKGTIVKVVVSDGLYAIMKDYVGQNVEEAREELLNTYPLIKVELVEVDSDLPSGTIITQEGIEPNAKFDPKRDQKITIKYSRYTSIIIPYGIIGSSIDTAESILKASDIPYELIPLDTSTLSDEEKASLVPNTIYNIDPKEGSSITVSDGLKVVLTYVEGESISNE